MLICFIKEFYFSLRRCTHILLCLFYYNRILVHWFKMFFSNVSFIILYLYLSCTNIFVSNTLVWFSYITNSNVSNEDYFKDDFVFFFKIVDDAQVRDGPSRKDLLIMNVHNQLICSNNDYLFLLHDQVDFLKSLQVKWVYFNATNKKLKFPSFVNQ